MKRLVVVLALAASSSGCLTYYAVRKVKGEPTTTNGMIIGLATETGIGLATGALVNLTADEPKGNVVVSMGAATLVTFAFDAAIATFVYALMNKDGDD